MAAEVYWLESLEYALDAAGCFDALTPDQRAAVAKSLCTSAENESQACGRPSGRDVFADERRQLQQRIHDAQRETEEWMRAFRRNVHQRRGWDVNRIEIGKDGSAELTS